MMNPRLYRKGFVLIAVMVFIIATLAAMVSLFMTMSVNYKVVGAGEADSMRGYYADIAALRYVTVMLEDPALVSDLTDGKVVTKTLHTDYKTLWKDLGLTGAQDIAITITPTAGGTEGLPYTVKADYTGS